MDKDQFPAEFCTLQEAGEFWDTHSAANYWGEMEDLACEVDIQDRRFAVWLEGALPGEQ